MDTTLLSVGIDIGTATTQVVFSRLSLANVSSYFSAPRVEITEKRVAHRGGIHPTPLLSPTRLDGGAIRRLAEAEFAKAGFSPRDTDTGAVIITGEAARKENADEMLRELSGFAGNFVVATAGPDLEGILAGKGSGAQAHSADSGQVVANLDIGGGTTNIAIFGGGEVVSVGCFDIGGRLVRLRGDGRIDSVSPGAKLIADSLDLKIPPGASAEVSALARLTDAMNGVLESALGLAPPNDLSERLLTPGSSRLRPGGGVDAVVFSGGVADCIYRPGREDFPYHDIGALLGRSIAAGRLRSAVRNIVPAETIRATVVGAGSYSTKVSGSTIACGAGVLPQKNLPVLKLADKDEAALFAGDAGPFRVSLSWFRGQRDANQLALGLKGRGNPGYRAVNTAAAGIASVLDNALPPGLPLFVALEHDIAKALGQCLEKALGGRRQVVCLDGIQLAEGDFLDIGSPVMNGLAVPVVVKTLIFG